MKLTEKIISYVLVLTVVFLPVCKAFAKEKTQQVYKEEVVYANLNADGSPNSVDVVNIFENSAANIKDYGDYITLRNMTTTDKIIYSEDTVTIDSPSGKIYYEGRLKNVRLPWQFSIKYYFDGREVSADDLAGKIGRFMMTIDISKNTRCMGTYYDDYALQLSMKMTGASDISAPGSTVANSGADKLVTYTILPGKAANIELSANIADFETDGISVNGIPINLNIDLDNEKLMDKISELGKAVSEIDDGAKDVSAGAGKLYSSADGNLADGTSKLNDGAYSLYSGLGEIKDGGANLVDGVSQLAGGSDKLFGGITSLNLGIIEVNAALNNLSAQSASLRDGSGRFRSALINLQNALSNGSTGVDTTELINASAALKEGLGKLSESAARLSLGISRTAFKQGVSQTGVNIDSLIENNTSYAQALETMATQFPPEGSSPVAYSYDPKELMLSAAQLLKANNAFIGAVETYLNGASEKLMALSQSIASLYQNYTQFDIKINESAGAINSAQGDIAALKDGVNAIVLSYSELESGVTEYTGALDQIAVGFSNVTEGLAELTGAGGELSSGVHNLSGGVNELFSGIEEAYTGSGSLYEATGELKEGVKHLLVGVAALNDGAKELKKGTSEFKNETSGMETEVREEIDSILDEITGCDIIPTSFVSAKNTAVKSVQFVLKTSPIKAPEADMQAPTEERPQGFFEKFLALFA